MVLKVRTSLLVPILVGLPVWLWLPEDGKDAVGTEVLFQHHFLKKRRRKKLQKKFLVGVSK